MFESVPRSSMALQPLESRSGSSSTLRDGLDAVDKRVKEEPQEDTEALLNELQERRIAHA